MRSFDGLIVPGICDSCMSFVLWIQSCIAKKQMLMCLVCSVGFNDSTMSIVGLLSLKMGVRPSCSSPSSHNTNLIYFAVFAAVTAAMNLASVKLSAVKDCVLDLYTTAPPA